MKDAWQARNDTKKILDDKNTTEAHFSTPTASNGLTENLSSPHRHQSTFSSWIQL
jgi:hypothetical protein